MTADAPWYSDPERLGQVLDAVRAVQPGLVLLRQSDPPVLRGEFLVREGDEVLERFAVEVRLQRQSDRALPEVREIGGRIPHHEDWHVSGDGTLCVVQPAAFWFQEPEGLTLPGFLQGPLQGHLAGQVVVARGGKWPVGAWGHGATGICECFAEILGVTAPGVVRALVGVIAGEWINGHAPCPCGSGRKFRKCHGPVVFKAKRNIPLKVRKDSYAALRVAPKAAQTIVRTRKTSRD